MIAIGNIYSGLTEVEKPYVTAFKGTRVVKMFTDNKKQLETELLTLVSKCCVDAGQVKNDLEKVNMVNEIILSCINSFPSITYEELKTALRNGIRGDFGDYFGLNVATLHKFIKGYLKEEKRIEAIKKQIDFEAEMSTYNNLDADKINVEFWEKEKVIIKKFLDTGELDIYSPRLHLSVYEEAGKIKLTASEKWELYNSELEKYKEELTKKAFLPHQREAWKAHKAEVIRFETDTLTPEDKSTIVQRACLTALKEYFLNQ